MAILILKMLTGTCLVPMFLKYHTGGRQGHMHVRGFFLHPMKCEQWRKLTNDREGIQCRNYDAAFRKTLKIIVQLYWTLTKYSFRHPVPLKVPKREIFDRSDFPDFYTIKSSWAGDLLVKILTYYFNF